MLARLCVFYRDINVHFLRLEENSLERCEQRNVSLCVLSFIIETLQSNIHNNSNSQMTVFSFFDTMSNEGLFIF